MLLFTLIGGLGYVALTSSSGGASNSGLLRNGAKGTPTTCGGGGCHTGTLAPIIDIRVDSVGGVEVSKYVAGMTYTVTVTASHPSNNAFGFQLSSVSGTGTAQVQAGSFASAGLPAQVAKRTSSGIEVMEQSSTISGALSKSMVWTAPATGSEDVKFYLTVNAVDGVGGASSGDASENMSITLPKHPSTSSVATMASKATVSAYPNPATNVLNIASGYANQQISIDILDMTGRNIAHQLNNTDADGNTNISMTNLAPGQYNVVIAKGAEKQTIQVVKQ